MRTANQVNAILSVNSIEFKATNLGDGRKFSINNNELKTRVAVKKAGFILQRCEAIETTCYFYCF
jgi:hypothetical protein